MSRRIVIRAGGPANWALRVVGLLVLVVVLLWIPTRGSGSLIESATSALVLMAAAMALNLLLGYTGQISLGHSAFFGIGVYTTAVCVTRWGWSPFLTIPVAFVLAFVVGVLVSLPALRIKGVYLALVTLALGLLFPAFIKWPKISWLTNGSRGLDKTSFRFTKDNPTYEIFGWNPWGTLRGENDKPFYFWIALVVTVIVYLVCRGVVKSRVGRALVAIRDNSTAAAVMGVDLAVTKGVVFGLSAGLCALPGSVETLRTGTISPDMQDLTVIGAITLLVVMVVGGAGSLWGPIVGAVVYVYVTETTGGWSEPSEIPALLRPLFSWSEVTPGGGIFSLALVALMFFAPFGIVGLWRKAVGRFLVVAPRPVDAGIVPPQDPATVES